ncbi:MAG: lipopolysaccharide biosynthesis protein [Clostridia bacterium]|nr:lipopolysaccharide biosynthesis protein [Clostridia bacterium]
MKRIEKSVRNMAYGLLFQVINIASAFVVRTALVNAFGVSVSGLNSVMTEVVALLCMAELGVGTAITYHLYKPLACEDYHRVAQLMRLFQTAYRVVAAAIALIGALTIPFIHLIVNDASLDLPYIRATYVLFIIRSSVSYLFSYKATLLNADQKSHRVSRINCIVRLITATVSVVVMVVFRSFFGYLAVEAASALAFNAFVSRAANREYPFLSDKVESLPRDDRKMVLSNVKHVFIGSISGKVTNSTDNVLISLLVSTATVGYYANYSLIINAVRNVINQITQSTHGAIGNVMASESDEKCDEILRRLTFVIFLISAAAGVCLYCLSSPFVGRLWYDESFIISPSVVFILSVNFFLNVVHEPLYQAVRTSDLFSRDKNISLLGSAVNLAVSLVLGKFIGMLGIFIGTTCTFVIQMTLKTRLLYARRLNMSPKGFFVLLGKMTAIVIAALFVAGWICSLITLDSIFVELLVKLVIALAVSAAMCLIPFVRSPELKYVTWLLKRAAEKVGARVRR